jgi:hypothetical protein
MSDFVAEGKVETPLEFVPNDLDDDIHKALDNKVLDLIAMDSPLHQPLSARSAAVLLACIVSVSKQLLDPKYDLVAEVTPFLRTRQMLVEKLDAAYSAGSFKEIRNLSAQHYPKEFIGLSELTICSGVFRRSIPTAQLSHCK